MSGGWNTIESDAGVFTSLLSTLGCPDIQCEELLSLDPDSLVPLSPLGVIFLFKYPTASSSAAQLPRDGTAVPATQAPLWFAQQTIQNACGTQALLGVALNQTSQPLGAALESFREFTSGFDPELRGEALSNATEIRDAHNAFARASPFVSSETRQAGEDDDAFHFIGYVPVAGRLWELDGLTEGPIDHGECGEGQFSEKVVPVLRKRIERYPADEIRFNLLAVCPDLRIKAREVGDAEWLYREEEKRRAWRWENSLRKHNFVGFIGELAKGVVADKVRKGEYDGWVKEATNRTQAKARARRDEMDIE